MLHVPPTGKADLVIINGKVFTIDKENPVAEAVAIKGEEMSLRSVQQGNIRLITGGTTKVIDAERKTCIPGFNDAHVHFGPLDPDYIELRYTTDPIGNY